MALIAFPDAIRVAMGTRCRNELRQSTIPTFGQPTFHDPPEFGGQIRMLHSVLPKKGFPGGLMCCSSNLCCTKMFESLPRDVEGRFHRPPEMFLG